MRISKKLLCCLMAMSILFACTVSAMATDAEVPAPKLVLEGSAIVLPGEAAELEAAGVAPVAAEAAEANAIKLPGSAIIADAKRYPANIVGAKAVIGGVNYDAVQNEETGVWVFTVPADTDVSKVQVFVTPAIGATTKPVTGTSFNLDGGTFEVTSYIGKKAIVTLGVEFEPASEETAEMEMAEPVTVTSYTRVYSDVSLKSTHLAHLNKGDLVIPIAEEDGWVLIWWDDITGETAGFVPAKSLK